MLDYDSMRSKVRRLTEKPDKDASKLPRAEKEADMVSLTDFLDEHRTNPPHAALAHAKEERREKRGRVVGPELESLNDLEGHLETELVMLVPSEPRCNAEARKAEADDKHKRSDSAASGWRSNVLARFAEVPSPTSNKSLNRADTTPNVDLSRSSISDDAGEPAVAADDSRPDAGISINNPAAHRQRSNTRSSSTTLVPTITSSNSNYSLSTAFGLDNIGIASSTDSLLPRDRSFSGNSNNYTSLPRSFTSPAPSTPTKPPHHQNTLDSPYGPLPISPLLYSNTFTTNPRNCTPSPFFFPSELLEIMAPLKRAFLKQRANELHQAKAAYEQLNEQLSTEIPQLIDLRVPYLDPSFEALVKIQLRFCAEAYSRMAQVQQYVPRFPFFVGLRAVTGCVVHW